MEASENKSGEAAARGNAWIKWVAAVVVAALIYVGISWYRDKQERDRHAAELAALAQMRDRAPALSDDVEKLKAYDAILDRFRDNQDPAARDGVAWATLGKAELTKDAAEKTRLLDQVIAMHRGDSGAAATANTVRALAEKAAIAETPAEKVKLYDAVIDGYAGSGDEAVLGVVAGAWWDKVKITTSRADGFADIDAMAARLGDSRFATVRTQVAKALNRKAELTDDTAAKAEVLDAVVDKYGSDDDVATQRQVAWAMFAKARLAANESDAGELYQAVVEKYRRSEDSYLRDRFTRAFAEEIKRIDDNAEKIARYDREIAEAKLPEKQLVEMRYSRANLLPDETERAAAFDAIIEDYAKNTDPDVMYRVAGLMRDKAYRMSDAAESKALFDAIVENYSGSGDAIVRLIVADALEGAARFSRRKTEKLHYLDRIIDTYRTDDDSSLRDRVTQAFMEKTDLTGDAAPFLAYCDALLAGELDDKERVRLLEQKRRVLTDPEECIALFDEIITRYEGSDDPTLLKYVSNALVDKAFLLDDDGERLACYDRVIALALKHGPPPSLLNWLLPLNADRSQQWIEAVKMKIRITGDNTFAGEVLNNVLAKVDNEKSAIGMLSSWAERIGDKEEKQRIYNDIIEKYHDNTEAEIVSVVMHAYDRLAEMTEARDEKIRLCDTIIDFPSPDGPGLFWGGMYRLPALKRKADLIDGKDAKIALFDDIIIRFGDDRERSALVEHAYMEKAKLLEDPSEKITLYNDMAARYTDSEPDRLLVAKARAYEEMALAQYEKILARHAKEQYQPGVVHFYSFDALGGKARLLDDKNLIGEYLERLIRPDDDADYALNIKLQQTKAYKNREDQITILDDLIGQYGDSDDSRVWKSLVLAMRQKMRLLESSEEKIKVCDEIIERFSPDGPSPLDSAVVSAIVDKAGLVGDPMEKIALLEEVARTYRKNVKPGVRRLVRSAMDELDQLRAGAAAGVSQ